MVNKKLPKTGFILPIDRDDIEKITQLDLTTGVTTYTVTFKYIQTANTYFKTKA